MNACNLKNIVYLQKKGKTIQWKTSTHQYVSPWSSQGNQTLNDLLFYLFDLSVLGQQLFCHGHCTYLHLALLHQAILADVPLLSAYEASPLTHHLLSVYVHWHALSTVCRPPPRSRVAVTCLKSVHTCNFVKCINTYILQNLDTKAMQDTLEHNVLSTGNEVP